MPLVRQDSMGYSVEDLAVLPQDCVRRALLIATGCHSRRNVGRLPGASPDVNLIRELLLEPRCGFKEDNVVVLNADDRSTDCPIKENITEALEKNIKKCGANDFFFLYLIGHGFYDSKTSTDYYVPFDAKVVASSGDDVSFSNSECFSLKSLRKLLDNCQARYKWVVVDSCRVKLNRDRFGVVYNQDQQANGKLFDTGDSLWFQSCGIGEKSYEIKVEENGNIVDHGLFTWLFYKGAKGEAADRFGRISPKGLFDYIRKGMAEYCKNEAVLTQIPLSSPNCSEDRFQFVFAGSNAETLYNEALDLFLSNDDQANQALEKITEALKFDPENVEYQRLKDRIEGFIRSKDIDTPTNDPPKATSKGLPVDYLDSNGKEYRLIKAGFFMMGSPLTGKEVVAKYTTSNNPRWYDDAPQHKVTLTQDFYLAKRPVTRGEFQRFVDATGYRTTAEKEGSAFILTKAGHWEEVKGKSWLDPGFEQTNEHPAVCVSYFDAIEYIGWLNWTSSPDQNGLKPCYRLPTEAEWEYACRAGTTTEFFWGDDEKDGKGFLNAAGTDGGPFGIKWDYRFPFKVGYPATSPVGSFKPNPWGLYDMLGNVWEWTSDRYGEYPTGAVNDPEGPAAGSFRALRGGGWRNVPASCRCACRDGGVPARRIANFGLRVAFSLTSK